MASDILLTVVNYIKPLPFFIKFLVLTVSIALEYIFPIFPGDTIVLLAGFLEARGALGLLEITISIVLGSILGALLGHTVGLWILNKSSKYKWLNKYSSPEALFRFNNWFRKWGNLILLFNRFFPGVRALFFVAAASAGIPIYRVLILGTISAILFNGCLLLLGYWLGYNAEKIMHYFYRYHIVAYLFMALLLCLIIIYYFWRKKHRK